MDGGGKKQLKNTNELSIREAVGVEVGMCASFLFGVNGIFFRLVEMENVLGGCCACS